jgi:hypothetical protein
VLLIVNVNDSVVELTEAKPAVTPAGTPVAEKDTRSTRLTGLVTTRLMGLLYPALSVRLLTEAARVKLDRATVSAIVVALDSLPEVPVTETLKVPGTAFAPGLSVNVVSCPLLAELNEAATPLGTPEIEKATLPVNPLCAVTVIALLTLAPAVSRVTVVAGTLRVNVGALAAAAGTTAKMLRLIVKITLRQKWRGDKIAARN